MTGAGSTIETQVLVLERAVNLAAARIGSLEARVAADEQNLNMSWFGVGQAANPLIIVHAWSETGPLSGCYVFLNGGPYGVTDGSGTLEIAAPDGTYEIVVNGPDNPVYGGNVGAYTQFSNPPVGLTQNYLNADGPYEYDVLIFDQSSTFTATDSVMGMFTLSWVSNAVLTGNPATPGGLWQSPVQIFNYAGGGGCPARNGVGFQVQYLDSAWNNTTPTQTFNPPGPVRVLCSTLNNLTGCPTPYNAGSPNLFGAGQWGPPGSFATPVNLSLPSSAFIFQQVSAVYNGVDPSMTLTQP